MNVLYLGPPSPILSYLRSVEEVVTNSEDVFATHRHVPDFVVSCGYRHILPATICKEYAGRIINAHISLLPWNRGASPNAWAWYEGTEHGVTIHEIDAGVDTGAIVAQEQVYFGHGETLASSYALLQARLFGLFVGDWPYLRRGFRERRLDQPPGGSYHSKADTERVITPLLTHGWDTPVSVLQEAGRKARKESK